jgi:YD repeat-containing protein
VGGTPWKTLATYGYDDMGRMKTRVLDPDYREGGLESLYYTYNIHNQITGINKDYALETSGVYNQWNHYFGEYFGYDNPDHAFTTARLDGKVAGQMWNTQGDATQRRYDYTYDNAGRLSGAAFTQKTGGAWSTGAGVDFSVSGVTYDADGNITGMKQNGLRVSTSSR